MDAIDTYKKLKTIFGNCRGKLIHENPGGPGPFRFGGGRRSHEEQIEARHTSGLPSFGALRRDNTPTAACLIVLCSFSRELSVFWLRNDLSLPERV